MHNMQLYHAITDSMLRVGAHCASAGRILTGACLAACMLGHPCMHVPTQHVSGNAVCMRPLQHHAQEKERIVTNLREVMGVSEQRHREIRTDIEAERKYALVAVWRTGWQEHG